MTYEYVCEVCGHQWEAEQSIKDRPLKKCVSCGVEKAKRLVSGGTGFLLKGGGWYADLYGSPGAGAKNGADDKGAKATTSSDAGGEAKPSTVESKPSTTEKSASAGAAAGSATSTAASATKAPAASAAKAS
jgi:putative FmdB family regulatory protein